MYNRIWASCDWHLWNKENTSKHPYRSISYINHLAENYQKDIKPGDLWLYLGDLCDPEVAQVPKLREIISSIPGYKVMCRGNKDTETDDYYLDLGFDAICDVCKIGIIVFSHKPVKIDPDQINIHGHLHSMTMSTGDYQHINVYCDTADNHPTSLDDVLDRALKQGGEQVLAGIDQYFNSLDNYTQYRDILDLTNEYQITESTTTPMNEILFPDIVSTEAWEQDDDYDPGKKKKEPMADGEGDIQNESIMSLIESVIFSGSDLEFNIDKWKPEKGHNILFVTGLSGSGKSTLARKYAAQYHATIFEIDCLDGNITDNSGILDKVLAQCTVYKRAVELRDSGEMADHMDEYFKGFTAAIDKAVAIMRADYKTLYICEGVQVYDGGVLSQDSVGYPLIIKNTSALTSIIRAAKRTKATDGPDTTAKDILKYILIRLKAAPKQNKQFEKYLSARKADRNLSEDTTLNELSSTVDSTYKPKGKKSLSSFTKKVCDEGSFDTWYQKFNPELSHVRANANCMITLWLTKDEEHLVAYICIEQRDDMHIIQALGVLPDYRGYGLSKQLMKYAKINDADTLYVDPSNMIAIKLYRDCGWKFGKDKNRGKLQPMFLGENAMRPNPPYFNKPVIYLSRESLNHDPVVCGKPFAEDLPSAVANTHKQDRNGEYYIVSPEPGYLDMRYSVECPNSWWSPDDVIAVTVGKMRFTSPTDYEIIEISNDDGTVTKLNEAAIKFVNDKGIDVPKVCPKCGAKVGVFLKGEPVFLCTNKKCGKYFGTVPFNESTEVADDTAGYYDTPETDDQALSSNKRFFNHIQDFRDDYTTVNESGLSNGLADIKTAMKTTTANAPYTGEWEKLHQPLLDGVKDAKTLDRLQYLRRDANAGATQLEKLAVNMEAVKAGRQSKYINVDDIEKRFRKGNTPTKVRAHIKWIKSTYIPAINARAKELRGSLEESYQFEVADKTFKFFDTIDESATNDTKLYPVYVMLIHSGSLLSNAIKTVTNSKFSHSVISFDSTFRNMYSFGRKRDANPFIGAFIKEDIKSKFYQDHPIPYAIYVVPCTAAQIAAMKKRLDYFIRNSTKFKYDFTGLFKNYFGIADNPEYKWFCSRFVADILNAGSPSDHPFIIEPSLMKPEDFRYTTFATYVTGGESLSMYEQTYTDKQTKRILRAEQIRRTRISVDEKLAAMEELPLAESVICNLDRRDPMQEKALSYQLSMLDEASIDGFLQYLQSFKLHFNKQGDIIISRREYDQLDQYAKRSIKMLRTYEKAGNMAGVKDELCRVRYMILLIDQNYLSPKAQSSPRTNADLVKQMTDLRSVLLNVFQQYLRKVTEIDPQYNFEKSYNASIYGKDTKIPKAVLTALGKTVLTKLT